VAESSASDDDSSLGESSQSVSPAEDILEEASDRAAVLIQKQFRSFLNQSSALSFSATAVALSDMPDVTETTYYEDDEDFTEETKEEEVAEEPKHRSGKFLWGVAGAAMTLVAPKMLGALTGGGSPVDEDDLMSGAMALQGNAGGGGAGGGGAGGAGAGGGAGGAGAGGAGAGAGAATATASTAQ
jgi:hypothetical protein